MCGGRKLRKLLLGEFKVGKLIDLKYSVKRRRVHSNVAEKTMFMLLKAITGKNISCSGLKKLLLPVLPALPHPTFMINANGLPIVIPLPNEMMKWSDSQSTVCTLDGTLVNYSLYIYAICERRSTLQKADIIGMIVELLIHM